MAFSAHDLPDEVAARCVRLVEAYGLCYGAIDLVLDPGGEYIFLELNPMGEWLFVQLATGLPGVTSPAAGALAPAGAVVRLAVAP